MSIALDGFAIFKAIGKHPDLFGVVRSDVDKQARMLFAKCLKSKSTVLATVREIYTAIGADPFELLADGLKDAELKSALAKIDRHNAEAKEATAAWRRQRLIALAAGEAPTAPPAKTAKKSAKAGKAQQAKAEPPRLHSKVMDQYREGAERKGKPKSKD